MHSDDHAHGHGGHAHNNNDLILRGRLKLAASITAAVFFIELIGGYLFGSLALMSDSAHVLMDVLALVISWFAHYLSSKPPTETRTYGLHRFEVLASLINGLSLLFISAFIFYRGAARLMNPVEVQSLGMLLVAAVGLGVNLFVAFSLKKVASTDLNVKSAYYHVIGDSLASVGVMIGAIVIGWTGFQAADPLISFVIAAIIITGAVRIVRDSTHILLEGVPSGVRLGDVVADITSIKGVTGVHSLHVWAICHNTYALSAHVDVDARSRSGKGGIFDEINEKLARNHHIFYTTLQADCASCPSDAIFRTIKHRGN
jgi:cobalt-zinc-cadmium efflux system protein